MKTKESLLEIKERAWEKFAPRMNDEPGVLWGKALRFMSLKMPDEAKGCIDMLRRRAVAEFPSVVLDVAEAVFFPKSALPFETGLLVCMFKSPATSHSIYKIGDVVTEVDGVPCRRIEDYSAKAGRVYTIYRRHSNGTFRKFISEMPGNQPDVAFVSLKEGE